MQEELAASYMSFVKENETSSQRACHSLLCSLHKPIEDDFETGKYACPGGYEVYKRSIDLLIRKYREAPRKGIMVGINSVDFSGFFLIVCMDSSRFKFNK